RPNAAEAHQHHRTPLRIAARADNRLDALLGHLLDQHALDRKATRPRHPLELRPSGIERCLAGEIEDDAAGIAFMREGAGLQLQRDRETDLGGDRARLIARFCEPAARQSETAL